MTQNNVIPFPTYRTGPIVTSVNPTSDGQTLQKPTSPALEQPQGQVFDIQNYIPTGKKIALIEASKGTHQIPHKIFEFMIKVTTTRVELAVFACLMRYTLGFHRSSCEASYSFISEWTGLSIASIRKGLESLLSEKLIQCVQIGSFRESAVYEIPLIKAYLGSMSSNHEVKVHSNPPESNSVCTQGAQGSALHSAPSMHTGVHPVGTKKDSINIKKEINTLSPLSLPEYLKTYFSNLKPEQKRKREQRHFDTLKNDYSVLDISDSLNLLVDEGIPGSGERCHSPMAFLACSMENVFSQVKLRREKILRKETQERLEAEKRSTEAKKKVEEESRLEEYRKLFETAFPTPEQQEAFFSQFATRFPFFKKSSFALRTAAISEWGSKLNQQT